MLWGRPFDFVAEISRPWRGGAPGEGDGVAGRALGAAPGEPRHLQADLLGAAGVEDAADLRVLALGVLADDHEVDPGGEAILERGLHARE
jgi:hypothetical protein